jgi:hypothetical protein
VVVDPDPPPITSSSKRRPIGIALTIGGGAVLAGGLVVGLIASGKYSDAKDVCGGLLCGTEDEFERGQQLVADARSRGNLATALSIGGGVLVATGLVLWFTAPSGETGESRERITIAPTTNGVSVSGQF